MTPGLLVTGKIHLSQKGKSIFADTRVTRSSRESFKLDLERKRDKTRGAACQCLRDGVLVRSFNLVS